MTRGRLLFGWIIASNAAPFIAAGAYYLLTGTIDL